MIFFDNFKTNNFLKKILTTVNWPLLIIALVFAHLSTVLSFLDEIRKFCKRKSLMKVLPGPCGYPIVGCAFSIDRLRPYKSFEEWANKYGPVFKVKIFNKYIVVLSDIQVFNIFLFANLLIPIKNL